MRLLAHLVVADVRRHRWLLSLWLLVLVASAIVQAVRPTLAAQPAAANTIALLDGLLLIVRLLLRVLLAALVVQTHPLVGSDAFWLTRPIPPMLLLRAKVVVLTTFLVLAPVAAEIVLMVSYGVPPSQIVRVAIESAVFAAMWAGLLATAAALTPTFARFVLLCGGVLATLALFLAIQVTIDSIAPYSPQPIAEPTRPENPAGAIVEVVAFILACTVTLVAQYRSRRLWRSAVIAVLMVVVMPPATAFLASPLLRRNVELPAWAARDGSLPIAVQPETVRSVKTEEGNVAATTPSRRTLAPTRISGLEPGWSAEISLLQASLEVDGGRTVTSISSPIPEPVTVDGAKRSRDVAISRVIGAADVIRAFTPRFPGIGPPTAALLVMPESEFARLAPVAGHYRGRFHVSLTRHEVEATLPLRPRAEVRNGSYWVVLDSAVVSSGRIELRLRESDATSSFDGQPRAERTYYVRNRRTGTALESRAEDSDIGLLPRMITGVSVSRIVGGFWAEGFALRFPPPWAGPDFAGLDETWLRDAELLIVRSTPAGGIERTLDIDRFPLDETAPTETRIEP
jgi:hypothetical protein